MGVRKENKMPESRHLLSTSHRATVSENVENKQTKNRECSLILNQPPPLSRQVDFKRAVSSTYVGSYPSRGTQWAIQSVVAL